jgi:hypothetical protein
VTDAPRISGKKINFAQKIPVVKIQ